MLVSSEDSVAGGDFAAVGIGGRSSPGGGDVPLVEIEAGDELIKVT